ncbi:enoyl-CoA hydratase [Angomonas deanei]|nr:enoyl-CoA hydratase [Angomonas deanei]|eukprot:EPY38444.1 enoyl-CoA hydratase [Angomonas deanei]
MDQEYYFALINIFHEINEDPSSRVAILTSKEGHAFTGGTNLKVLAGETAKKEENPSPYPAMRLQKQHTVIRRFQDCISSIARCRVPVLAAVDRYCIGGGTSVLTACDVRYSTENTIFSVKEAAVGLAADVGVVQRLPQIVGQGRARELLFTARNFSAKDAKAYGLLEDVYSDYPIMLKEVRQVAEQIAANSPLAVQGGKMLMNWGLEDKVQRSLEYTAAWNAFNIPCDDIPEAKDAFLEKRPPHFKNRVLSASSSVPLPPDFDVQ